MKKKEIIARQEEFTNDYMTMPVPDICKKYNICKTTYDLYRAMFNLKGKKVGRPFKNEYELLIKKQNQIINNN